MHGLTFHFRFYGLVTILCMMAGGTTLYAQQLSANIIAAGLAGQNTIELNTTDTSITPAAPKKIKYYRPTISMFMSALVPGAGQIYNRKYWKAPIIWAAIGSFGYLTYQNHTIYRQYRDAIVSRTLETDTIPDQYEGFYSTDQLVTLQDESRQNRDLFLMVTSLLYVLNMVDAMVDAHLYKFDVSDDLSIRWSPVQVKSTVALTGFELKYRF